MTDLMRMPWNEGSLPGSGISDPSRSSRKRERRCMGPHSSMIMVSSMLILNFGSQDELEHYLATEPYITGKVWQTVDVKPCRVPELFLT
jgi:uncharacterized membrane protein